MFAERKRGEPRGANRRTFASAFEPVNSAGPVFTERFKKPRTSGAPRRGQAAARPQALGPGEARGHGGRADFSNRASSPRRGIFATRFRARFLRAAVRYHGCLTHRATQPQKPPDRFLPSAGRFHSPPPSPECPPLASKRWAARTPSLRRSPSENYPFRRRARACRPARKRERRTGI